MARIYLCQDIAHAQKALINPYINDLKEEIQRIKEEIKRRGDSTSSANASPGLAAVVGVSTIGALVLTAWLGVKIGNFQTLSNHRQAIELWDWNQVLVEKARSENKDKTTLWLQPPREK